MEAAIVKEIEGILRPFANKYSMEFRWSKSNDQEILRLPPLPGSPNAPACVTFHFGFEDAYKQVDTFTQECARQNILNALEMPYKADSKAAYAHNVDATARVVTG